MRSIGLITEYNPFHNGHLYHLRQSLHVADAEVAVAVMSGHFLQRGVAALADKWVRTRMALAAGVDLVIELPLPWACSSAPDFARGAVQSLTLLGGIDSLCFGSESGELAPLRQCADLLQQQDSLVAERTARLLRSGQNYPQARATVLAELTGMEEGAAFLAGPNNILGIEYLRALNQTGSAIKPLTIVRRGAGYHATDVCGDIASATGIRTRLAAAEPVSQLLPADVAALLAETLARGQTFSEQACFRLLLGKIFSAGEQLSRYWLVDDGIENRLQESADGAADLEELIQGSKARQLTRTRIQRMLVAILLGLEKETARQLLAAGPQYLHLLGVSSRGRRFLAGTRTRREVPLVQNFSRIFAQLKRRYDQGSARYELAMQQLQLELTATRIYGLVLETLVAGRKNRDFYEPVVEAVSSHTS